MKRLLTLGGATLLTTALLAQIQQAQLPKGKAPKITVPKGTHLAQAKAGGSCILGEDFETSTLADLWTAGWDGGAQVETQNDDTGVGTGNFVDVWRLDIASAANNGGYFPVPDDPTLNKFIFANDDGDSCNCDMIDVSLQTPNMDFTGMTQMSMGFRAYSDENFGGGNAEVSVSTDGGAAYTPLFTIPAVESEWQEFVLDLSAYDGMGSVRVRFSWTDNDSWATGLSLDDICVAPILPNNMALNKVFTEDITGSVVDNTIRSLEYSMIPAEQVQEVRASATVTNNGGTAQTNVTIDVEVFFNSVSQGTFPGGSVASLNPTESAVITCNSGFVPTGPGTVEVIATVSADQTDDEPSNNVKAKTFEITGPALADGSNAWARDRGTAASFSGGTDPFGVANLFESIPAGSTIYGVGICFGNGDDGAPVTVNLWDPGFGVLTSGDYEYVAATDGNVVGEGDFTYIPFNTTYSLGSDEDVIAGLMGPGGNNTRTANSGTPPDTSSFFNDGADWGWVSFTPMVRLFLGNAVGVPELEENGVTLGTNMPNPFNGNTAVQFGLPEARIVTFEVRDNQGRVVYEENLGTKGAGKHLIDFDARGFAAGSYTYTLTAGQDRLTRNMVIAR